MMGYYPKRRGRPRKYKKEPIDKLWEEIHYYLQELLNDMTHHKSQKDYIETVYGGTLTQLKTHCGRILNRIQAHEQRDLDDRDKVRWE